MQREKRQQIMTDSHKISMQKIPISEMENYVHLGHAEDTEAETGVTVLYFPTGAEVGSDISGGGPASRETPLTHTITADNPINALVLGGGSAYGLAAADGVMRCLEQHGIGYDTGAALVPLVVQSCIYDLSYGRQDVRPDAAMGWKACECALLGTSDAHGNVGGGTGATVGKLAGMKRAQKSGLGIYAVKLGELMAAAVVIVNAVGDVYDPATGQMIAGTHDESRSALISGTDLLLGHALHAMRRPKTPKAVIKEEAQTDADVQTASDAQTAADIQAYQDMQIAPDIRTASRGMMQEHTNTTIGAVITNAAFSTAEVNKLASMTRAAYARCIRPVGTMGDGDSIYFASAGAPDPKPVSVDINVMGVISTYVMERAILDAVRSSKIPDAEFLAKVDHFFG